MLAIVFFPFFDPLYLILIAPAFILAMWAQNRVKKTYAEYSKVVASSAIPAHVAARRLLDAVGLNTFDASRRALGMMQAVGVINGTEGVHAKKVLDAAALTYVAAMFVALMQVLYFALRLLALSGRR